MKIFGLWMDRVDSKEKLSDIDLASLDEACEMIYNLHEDALCLKEAVQILSKQKTVLEKQVANTEIILKQADLPMPDDIQGRFQAELFYRGAYAMRDSIITKLNKD